MKRNLLKSLAVAAFAMVAGYNVYQSDSKTEGMSELMLANVEALASGEYGGNSITCYYGDKGSAYLCKCSSCTWGYVVTSSKGTCY